MNKDLASEIIRDTFNKSFNLKKFEKFIKNLLNTYEPTPNTRYVGNYIPDAFKPYIKSMNRIGKYNTGDKSNKRIDILEVHLKKETSLERARTTQRNFVAWYLDGSRGGVQIDAALVAFHSDNAEDWRFSLVKLDYELGQTASGNIKTEKKMTPAKRYSFLVGSNENTHTAQQQLFPILQDDENNPTLEQLEEAFNIETVTKEFFTKYRELFLRTKEELDKIVIGDPVIINEFEEKNVNTVDFAKKLLGQIVFLYFLQKKGWFGVERNSEWGTGPKNFLRKLFNKEVIDYNNYFNDVLEPLFYQSLATQRDSDYDARFNCKIPFLNGGLFDPIYGYDWVKTDIVLPDELFSNDFKTKESDDGTGILDIFDRYNFTVKEDEPLEKEVAIDPEFLGKIFEKLNAVNARNFEEYKSALVSGRKNLERKFNKEHGVFYTPRYIVHYICQQCLINYLSDELKKQVSKDDIEILIILGDMIRENDQAVLVKEKETKKYSFEMPESIRENAILIDEKLKAVKICDPAVGSGAFLVGIMNEIVRLRETLSIYLSDQENRLRSSYSFKHQAIHYSLYGVDIDPGAVEIAKLRLWLSLVIEEEGFAKIKPLPNLDYRIMQGDSLIEEFEGIKLFDDKKFAAKKTFDREEMDELIRSRDKLQKQAIKEFEAKKHKSAQKILKEAESLDKRIKKLEKLNSSDKYGEFLPLHGSTSKRIEIEELHNKYFEESRRREKAEIKKKIDELEWELIEETLKESANKQALKKLKRIRESGKKPFFLWKLQFPEVFYQKNGFDIVIGNPPYIRHEELKEKKIYFEYTYKEVYNGKADIYVYFINKGINLLKQNGSFSIIVANKWIRSGYGSPLRKYLTNYKIDEIIDFNDLPVFDNATTYPCIIRIIKKKKETKFHFTNITTLDCKKLSIYIERNRITVNSNRIQSANWTLIDEQASLIIDKMNKTGDKMNDYIDDKIYYGIKTGLNSAFVIDSKTKDRLIKQNVKSSIFIHPLADRIKRYEPLENDKYLIVIPNGWTKTLIADKKISEKEAFKKFRDFSPAIADYLINVANAIENGEIKAKGKGLFKRDDQGEFWWELRPCVYYEEFEKPKILFPDISNRGNFTLDKIGKHYCVNNSYIIGSSSKYLLGILNSKLITFFYKNIAPTYRGGYLRFIYQYLASIPIKVVNFENDFEKHAFNKIEECVNSILLNKQKCLSHDGTKSDSYYKEIMMCEQTIDSLVYKLYDLTSMEITYVEKSVQSLF